MLLLFGVRNETEPGEDLLRAEAPLARRIDAGVDMVFAAVVAAEYCCWKVSCR
jgi:hypothetical protein